MSISLGCPRRHLLEALNPESKEVIECDRCGEDVQLSACVQCKKCDYNLCEDCQSSWKIHVVTANAIAPAQLIFSAHGDTNFDESFCQFVPNSQEHLYFGHLDNFVGVQAMLTAYFSGKLPQKRIQCKITYGEEASKDGVDFTGAREVMEKLNPQDFVVVVDVTGVESLPIDEKTVSEAHLKKGHVIFEKVKKNALVLELLEKALGSPLKVDGVEQKMSDAAEARSYSYEIWHECMDPQCFEDETDVYRKTQDAVVFLGVPTSGGKVHGLYSNGDYNGGPVFCWKKDVEAITQVIIDLSKTFSSHF
jgi:hypothetical protein